MSTRVAEQRASLLLACALACGCDGLGKPVVDNVSGLEGGPEECPKLAPRCDDENGAPEEVTDVGAERGLPDCDLGDQASSAQIVTALSDCHLLLSASDGAERELFASALTNVALTVDNDVALKIVNSQLFKVSLATRTVAPDLPASLQVSHTDVRVSEIAADRLEMISSFLRRVSVVGSELSGVDLQTEESQIRADNIQLSAASLNTTHLGDCDALLIAGSKVLRSHFDACSGPTRIYDVEATRCTFDGTLVSDDSTFVAGLFGVNEKTTLLGWMTSINNESFCDRFEGLRTSGGSLTCTGCVGPLAKPEPELCFDTLTPTVENNFCEALNEDAPVCPAFPRHERPITGS